MIMGFPTEKSALVLSFANGLASYVSQELRDLGFPIRWEGPTAVETEGTLLDTLRLNLHLRTVHRVFYLLGEFRARDPDALYERLVEVPWEDYIPSDGYFTVDAFADTPTIRDSRFAGLRVKDAVADRMRARCGERPNSGSRQEGVALYLHWCGDAASIYLNTTGGSLSRRGYRSTPTVAPMRESLAAALVLASGWTGEGHFLNPMCGSGTLAIEAAWLALNRAPGLLREEFAFMHLRGYDPSDWRRIRQQAVAAMRPPRPGRIIASDSDTAVLQAARAHAQIAGVADRIEFDVCDLARSPVPEASAGSVIVVNPPYGVRLGDAAKLRPTYAAIGSFLRRQADGYRGFVFTANPELAEQVGLRARRSLPFFNGPLEGRLLEFEAYHPTLGRRVGPGTDESVVSAT